MKKIPIELLVWVSALIWFACIDPSLPARSFCLFHNLGLAWCPGCGIGHSLSYLLHGNVKASLEAHPFGLPALLILVHRIYRLGRREILRMNISSSGKSLTTYNQS